MSSGKDITQRLFAVFARANYSYQDKYLLGASIRHEGSSKFASANRWANFWSVNAGWRISKENFMIGDLSLSEGYAMDALTMAKRKGSPRMLKRLVQINLINKNNAVASKYIQMLSEMAVYHQWASKYQSYINNPEKMLQDKELSHKPILDMKNDNLLCMIEMDSLWQMHLTEPVINKTALEYLGCAYLLTKKMDSFKSFISEIANIPEMNPLPIHFQEAAMFRWMAMLLIYMDR